MELPRNRFGKVLHSYHTDLGKDFYHLSILTVFKSNNHVKLFMIMIFFLSGHRKTTYIARQTSHTIDSDESNSDSDEYDKNLSASSNSTNDSSDGDESVTNSPKNFSKKKIIKNANKATYGRNWCGDMSARSNQDNQREFEERAMKQVIELVGKKTGSDHNLAFQSYVQGGTFIKLETEWRENVKQKGSSSSTKVKCTTK